MAQMYVEVKDIKASVVRDSLIVNTAVNRSAKAVGKRGRELRKFRQSSKSSRLPNLAMETE